MQAIIFSISLPLKETYPSWNYPLELHNLDLLFQRDRFQSFHPLHHLAAENFCFCEFWNISANSKDCRCLLVTGRYQQQPVVATLPDSRQRSPNKHLYQRKQEQFAPPVQFLCWHICCRSHCQGWASKEVFYFHTSFKRLLSITLFL